MVTPRHGRICSATLLSIHPSDTRNPLNGLQLLQIIFVHVVVDGRLGAALHGALGSVLTRVPGGGHLQHVVEEAWRD